MRAADRVEVDACLELRLELPAIRSGDEAGEIWCRGRVVRITNTHTHDGYAVAIEQYDLLPPAARFLTH